MSEFKTAAEYLRTIPTVSEARPVKVTIGRETFEGAFYRETLAHNGEPYTTEKLYLVGTFPASYRRRRKTSYCFPGDEREWYVACYSPEVIKPEFAAFHPFGKTFILAPWDVPSGEAIDKYETKPYTRVLCSGFGRISPLTGEYFTKEESSYELS